jgi:hypothetical protein
MSVLINHFVSIRSVAVGSRNCRYFSAIQVLPGTNGPFFLHLIRKKPWKSLLPEPYVVKKRMIHLLDRKTLMTTLEVAE